MQHNPKNFTKSATSIEFDAHVATATGTGVDCSLWRFLKVIAAVGVIESGATMTITLEESDSSGSGYAAITGGAFTVVAVGNTGVDRYAELFLQQRKKYIRAVATYAGNGTLTASLAVLFELSGPKTSDLASNTYDIQLP
jgi:hypothetical protein